jgi:8-oxo-dGTP pyrophosphatase MutT (NUDIX family)
MRPPLRRALQRYWRWSRGLTIGTRIAVVERRRIFLVRHTYTEGWYLPGGGVEFGETVRHSLDRELMEEAGIRLDAEPRLHGVFLNEPIFPGDHVVAFVAEAWTQVEVPYPSKEIADAGLFDVGSLPEGTTDATRRRIAEIFEGAPVSTHW